VTQTESDQQHLQQTRCDLTSEIRDVAKKLTQWFMELGLPHDVVLHMGVS